MTGATNRDTFVAGAQAVNLNQAQNTVLFTFNANKTVIIHRYGVIADAAAGLLAPMDLKLRSIPIATGTAADLANTQLNGAAKARGLGIVKTMTERHVVTEGDAVVIAVETAAGGVSTGDVWIEYSEEPFNEEESTRYTEQIDP